MISQEKAEFKILPVIHSIQCKAHHWAVRDQDCRSQFSRWGSGVREGKGEVHDLAGGRWQPQESGPEASDCGVHLRGPLWRSPPLVKATWDSLPDP